MKLLDKNFVVEGGHFYKDRLSDNAYMSKYRVTCNDIRDGIEVQYMPDEEGLVLYTTIDNATFVFDEEDYRFGTLDEEEIRRLAHHFKTTNEAAQGLVEEIFDDAIYAAKD